MMESATKPAQTHDAVKKRHLFGDPLSNLNSQVSFNVSNDDSLQRKAVCACGGGCPACEADKRILTKLTVGEANDEYEQEADRVVDQVMAAQENTPIRTVAPRIQRLAGPSACQMDAAPASVARVLANPGSPLEPGLRQDMEQRFGHDFSKVRVHAGTVAEQSAKAMNAAAYTVGQEIVFGEGQFTPGTHEGRRLVAHELTHVLQQTGSDGIRRGQNNEKSHLSPFAPTFASDHPLAFGDAAPNGEHGRRLRSHELVPAVRARRDQRVARQPLSGYETKAVNFDRTDIEKLVGKSYLEDKVATAYSLLLVNTVQSRFSADAEERDAVLSVLWQRRPKSPTTSVTVIQVSIPPRLGATKSKTLLYQFTFKRAPSKGAKEIVEVEFKAEDAQAMVSIAPAAPASYTPPALSRNAGGFPEGIDKYWQVHPEEHKQLYSWIENAAGPKFDQVVSTSETASKGKKHDSSYHVKGTKNTTGKLTSLDIDLLGETPTFIDNPPVGYVAKDTADTELEKLHAKATDKLGQVKGLSSLPTDEQLSVKYVIWQYFSGGTRNKEVDVVVPIAGKAARVLYTLRFRPTTNDVDVERVGEEGSSLTLTANALNITRVEGFSANSTDVVTFKAWIAKRYPSLTLKGTTLPELQENINKEMTASVGTTAWFKTNYGIEILDATAAETRLQKTHSRTSAETANLKTFSDNDLKRLEFALGAMSDIQLQVVKGTQMARQDVLIEIKDRAATPNPKIGGITWQSGSEKTIIIFDSASTNGERLFIGGTAGVRFSPVQTFVHEFGHIFAEQAKLEKPFDDFVKKKRIKPITSYASSKPVTESFPEAFAVFLTDPEWMKTNLPELFAWFETVKTSGKPPASP